MTADAVFNRVRRQRSTVVFGALAVTLTMMYFRRVFR
jgi:hypothetical protein